MKTLPLFLLLLAIPQISYAEDDNYEEPAYEAQEAPDRWEVGGSKRFLDLSLSEENDLRVPVSGSREDYIQWALALMLSKKKEALAIAASAQPTGVRGVKCLRFHKSFGFRSKDGMPISTAKDFSVSCFAGGSKLLPTHKVYNNIAVQDSPAACTGEARIREFFSRDNVLNPNGAKELLTLLKVTNCNFLAYSQNHLSPPPRAQEAFDVNRLVNDQDFQLWRQNRGVAGSDRGRKSDGPFKNPIGTVRKPTPPAYKRTSDGEDDLREIPAR